jgi:PKD repeat protein
LEDATLSLGKLFVRFCQRVSKRRLGQGAMPANQKLGLEQLEERLVPSATRYLLDFGTSGSPVEADFTRVLRQSYDAGRGFGWQSVNGISAYNHAGTDPLTRDGHRGSGSGMFLADLENGTYHVTATVGESGAFRDNLAIIAEGQRAAEGITTAKGQFQQVGFDVDVTDGQLNLQFLDEGGKNPYFSVAALRVERIDPIPPPNSGRLDLVAAFGFDEGSGTTAADASGNGNTGMLDGATWTAAGKFGGALSFDGSNALVNVADASSLDLTTAMTLEAWVKPTDVSSDWRDVIYKGNDSYYLEASSPQGQTPGTGGTFSSSPLYGTGALAANTWSHLAATYDGSTLRLYVNGVQVASRAQTGLIHTSNNPLQIGGDSIFGQFFAGLIDEVRVYNRALSASEIQADMNTPVGNPVEPPSSGQSDPVAAYSFDEGVGTTAADASGNGNTGMLDGATWTAAGKYGGALSFDGSSALVNVADASSLDLTTAMTLEAWVKPTDVSSDWRDVIYKGNDSYYLEASSPQGQTPGTGGTFSSSPLYGTGALAANTWSHLAATYDGSTLRLYVNGVQVASRAQTGLIHTSNNPLQIGGDSIFGQFFAGLIDEVRVYNRALSASEIQADMNTPVGNPPTSPAPTANAGAAQSGDEGSALQLKGSATGQGLSYAWDFGDGTQTTDTLAPSHTYDDNGNYTVTLTVTDSSGRSASDTATVSVGNVAPTARMTDDNPIPEGSVVHISFINQSDPSSVDQAAGFKYSYDFNNDGIWDLVNVSDEVVPYTYTDNGNYTVRGRITDKDGGFTDYTDLVEVTNVAPTATFSSSGSATTGTAVAFSFTGQSDPSSVDQAAGFRYSYDFNGDGTFEVANATTATASYTYTATGTYVVKGRITDKDGASSDYTTTINITTPIPPAPTVNAGADQSGDEGSSVQLQGSATGNGLSYTWSFGDGTQSTGTLAPSHTYADNGNYTVTLSVTDSLGRQASDTALVSVRNVAPTATFASSGSATTGTAVTFSFTNQTDPSSVDQAAGFRYSYDFNGDGTFEVANATTATASYTYTAAGTYVVKGRITDKDGASSDYTTTVTVSAATGAGPTANAGADQSANEGAVVSFQGSATGDGLSYSWDFGDGSSTSNTGGTPGLVAAFGFDDGTGTTVADASGNGNSGVLSGATWTTAGQFGGALLFNGSNALVSVADTSSLDLTTAMTLEAWVKPTTVSGDWSDVIYKGNDSYYLEGSSPQGQAPATGGTFSSSPLYGTGALAANTWSHLAATYDGSTLRLYVNGVQVASRTQTGLIHTSNNPLQIGGDSLYGQFFAGLIDEVRVYNRALSASEIQADMNTPVANGNSDTLTPTHVYADNGTYTVTLTVTDSQGHTANDSATVTVQNVAPTASFSSSATAPAGTTVAFNFTNQTDPSSVDRAAGFRYSYDFNGDGTFEVANSTTATASYTFATAGTYVVKGRIADKDGASSDYTTSITITNPTAGRTFYVSSSGSDSASGTATSPWKTLQHAADLVQAGDTVIVRAGTYAGFQITTDGTASKPITFKADPGVLVNAKQASVSSSAGAINIEGADYIIIDGFNVTLATYGSVRANIRSVENTGVIIRNNTIDNASWWGILTGNSANLLIENNTITNTQIQHGIYVGNSADNPIIRGNYVANSRGAGIQINADKDLPGDGIISNALVEGNTLINNARMEAASINLNGVEDSRILNNVIVSPYRNGIAMYQDNQTAGTKRNLVAFNTIIGSAWYAISISGQGSTDNKIFNNILFSQGWGSSYRGGLGVENITGLQSDNNILVGRVNRDPADTESPSESAAQWQARGFDTHSIFLETRFASPDAALAALFVKPPSSLSAPATGDYHLKLGSLAINGGVEIANVLTDIEGKQRDAMPDIGAYEY